MGAPRGRAHSNVARLIGEHEICCGRSPVRSGNDIERNLLALLQSAQSCAFHRRDMDEDVSPAILRFEKAVTLLLIEPRDCSHLFRHLFFRCRCRCSGETCWRHSSHSRLLLPGLWTKKMAPIFTAAITSAPPRAPWIWSARH
jgi:hypothetical protein